MSDLWARPSRPRPQTSFSCSFRGNLGKYNRLASPCGVGAPPSEKFWIRHQLVNQEVISFIFGTCYVIYIYICLQHAIRIMQVSSWMNSCSSTPLCPRNRFMDLSAHEWDCDTSGHSQSKRFLRVKIIMK